MTKIVYFDMDGVLVNFESAFIKISNITKKNYIGHYDDIPGIFNLMEPNKEILCLFNKMMNDNRYDVYILSSAPWNNPSAWSDKLCWIKKYIPNAQKRLILSHNKHLNKGDYLIDDRLTNGADKFEGELILWPLDIKNLYKKFDIYFDK